MLTLAHKRTCEFIRKFLNENGFSPTASEIAAGIGIKSRGVVHRYLKVLEDAGYLKLIPKRHRNIQLLEEQSYEQPDSYSVLPLLGAIAAGRPIEAITTEDSVNVSQVFTGKNRYALRVKGDSMVDDGIFDGDLVICERSETAVNGQIVVALIDQHEATLKRFEYSSKEKRVILHPANVALKPMVYEPERVSIQGVYLGLLRVP